MEFLLRHSLFFHYGAKYLKRGLVSNFQNSHFSVSQDPVELITILRCLIRDSGAHIHILQGQSGPVITPGTGSPYYDLQGYDGGILSRLKISEGICISRLNNIILAPLNGYRNILNAS
jgi:hypothetical protein